jgi:transcriptional regulator with XRE-family HTH domain
MPNPAKPGEVQARARREAPRQPRKPTRASEQAPNFPPSDKIDVGRRLRQLRLGSGLSIRALAERSKLNFNTLSLIENGRTSPSVSTLQQLANGLEVPITVFFEDDLPRAQISFLKAGQRRRVSFAHGLMEDLGGGLTLHGGQPFLVILEPKADSGPVPIVHTGLEFVYCLEGHLAYTIDDQPYQLDPGDSLLFEAYLPHCWQNIGQAASRSLLVLCPADESDHPTERHFIPEKKETL